jgi:hypothetical protein
MSWARILENDPGPDEPLRQRIDALFAEQRQTWPTFRAGEAALKELPTKTLTLGDDFVVVQLNVGRRPSILAKTDPESIAARACFLCPANMPPEERGVAFEDLIVLPNPYPCLPLHCTMASREHVPQRIGGRIESFLRLAKVLGPDLVVTYNGPSCGASAPDHFHFQCVEADGLPIFKQLTPAARRGAVALHSNFGREMYVFNGPSARQVHADIEQMTGTFPKNATDEPMINLAASFDGECFTVLLFPRTCHRPTCYFASGPEQIAVSPGVLEMCGLFVVTQTRDFDRMDTGIVRSIFDEVCATV